MIGRTNCGAGGGGTVGVTIYGGANEVITYSGKASGTFTLDSAGAGTIELKKGVYTFTAGLSGLSISKACENGTVVRLRPERFIFWYGVNNGSFSQSGGTLTYETDSLHYVGPYQAWGSLISNIDCSQDTTMSMNCTTMDNSTYCVMTYSTKNDYSTSGGVVCNLKKGYNTLTYAYNADRKARLSIYGQYDVILNEWYLGNREAG